MSRDLRIVAEDDSPSSKPTITDSGYETDVYSLGQTSLADSAFDFLHEHGHRYHRRGDALLPNDETEQDRLDLQHHIFRMVLDGGLCFTSFPDPTAALTVLDIGTGTGIWAIEMGDLYPEFTIKGIDESPIQPSWVPPNVQFELDDVNKPWLTRHASVDFIHIRTMAGCIADWPALLGEAWKALKPGGRIEVTDITWHFECQDGTFTQDFAAYRWAEDFHALAESTFHVDFKPSPKMAGWLAGSGFESVAADTKIVPIGPWPKDLKLKEIGRYFLSQMLEGGMENYSMALFTKAGWKPAEVHAMLGKVRAEIQNPRVHAFTRAWFITARKPLGTAS